MKRYISTLLLFIPLLSFAQSDSIGIYMKNGDSISKIEPINNIGYKTNTLGSALTMGVASSTIKVVFKGGESKNYANNETVFYFYYGSNTGNNALLLMRYHMFISESSPESDFSLVKFIKKKNKRELKTGTVNIYSGVNMGTDSTTESKFIVEKIDNTKYKVTLKNMESGEYCFMYNGINGSGAYMPVFDFSMK